MKGAPTWVYIVGGLVALAVLNYMAQLAGNPQGLPLNPTVVDVPNASVQSQGLVSQASAFAPLSTAQYIAYRGPISTSQGMVQAPWQGL